MAACTAFVVVSTISARVCVSGKCSLVGCRETAVGLLYVSVGAYGFYECGGPTAVRRFIRVVGRNADAGRHRPFGLRGRETGKRNNDNVCLRGRKREETTRNKKKKKQKQKHRLHIIIIVCVRAAATFHEGSPRCRCPHAATQTRTVDDVTRARRSVCTGSAVSGAWLRGPVKCRPAVGGGGP